jgi:hypothetical protein
VANSWVTYLKKKLIVTCPCGYRTTIFTDEIEAVSIIQLHIEKFHKDALPFGITTAEALTLLREDYRETRIQPNQRQIESSYGLRDRASLQNKKRGNPILYDMENPIS